MKDATRLLEAILFVSPRPVTRDELAAACQLEAARVDEALEELRGELEGFDVVLSDMAPDTSGVRSLDQARSEGLFERALEIAELTLVKGGHFVGKLFQGPDWPRLIKRAREGFAEVRTVKPAGSRKESIEQYVVAKNRR
jgi:23S rRNA (uridine2552-2'-O)-methyltransferase